MPNVRIEKVGPGEERTLPVFAEIERAFDRVRERAFELSEGRQYGAGRALDDWLTAEREICWPKAELVERDADFVASIALPGFEPGEVGVTVTPRELIVHAESRSEVKDERRAAAGQVRWSEFRSNDVYRRIEFPAEIDVEKVGAVLKNGLLEVVAAKLAKKPPMPVKIATAA